MNISLNWINDYVDIKDIDVEWLVNKLTITTAEIEGVHHLDNDVIIEIDNKSLTNRPDLWCHYGIAREISAITGRELKNIDYIKKEELRSSNKKTLDIHIEDQDKCLRYSAIKIGNIKLEKSPEFIAERLANCGIKPINIIVDIANYVMLDIGQPLHTFDEKDIPSIRAASLKEAVKFTCLDDVEREIPENTLMINSNDKPLAIAGIIGGAESAISENSQGMILESATFEGTAVRKAASAIGIRTDASARYEKFLDIANTVIAVGRFVKLLKKYQPDIVLETSLYDNIINAVKPINISIGHKYIETYLGEQIDSAAVIKILSSLKFEVEAEASGEETIYKIKVPTYRATKDITCKADIIEEILRLYGYDKIKGKTYKSEASCPPENTIKKLEYSIKDNLVKKLNFNEIHTYSWYDNNWLKKLDCNYSSTLKIVNTSIKQFDSLRSDIAPNILKVIYDNRKSYEEIRVYEIGRIFMLKDEKVIQPKHLVAAIYTGKSEEQAYSYIKGICSYLLKNLKNLEAKYTQIEEANKENCLSINYDNKLLGYIYSATKTPAILRLFGSTHTVNIIDIDLDVLDAIEENPIRYKPISKFPETYLDFSILSLASVPYSEIETLVNGFSHQLILETKYMDIYSGENVPQNMKSTTVRMIIGDPSRTLQLEEINEVKERFISYLKARGLLLR